MNVNSHQVDGDHYRSDYQHWDFATDCDLGYFESVITKYITRWRSKNGLVDLEKALHYTEKLITLVEDGRVTRRPSGAPALVRTFAKANGLDEREELIVLLMSIWKDTGHLKDALHSIELLMKGMTNETPVPDPQAEVKRVTDTIMENLGDCSPQDALTGLCDIGGHLIASICEGRLGDVKLIATNIGVKMCELAQRKMIYDAEKRVKELGV